MYVCLSVCLSECCLCADAFDVIQAKTILLIFRSHIIVSRVQPIYLAANATIVAHRDALRFADAITPLCHALPQTENTVAF